MSLATGQVVQLVYLDSVNVSIQVPLGGKNNIPIMEEVPRGIKRKMTFGHLQLQAGAARNFQIFIVDHDRVRFPVSPNDSNPKGLTGTQIIKAREHIEIDVAAGANTAELAGSVSYEDYLVS